MGQIIDRRLNTGDKNLGNRERFKQRMDSSIRKHIRDNLNQRSVADIKGGNVSINKDGISEPVIHRDGSGNHEYVVPGNSQHSRGDQLPKPKGSGGNGGPNASADGEGDDEFEFYLTAKEYMGYLLDDLELPFWMKKNLLEGKNDSPSRAGYSVAGSPSNLAVLRTMRNSLSRRIALNRPSLEEVEEVKARLGQLLVDQAPEAEIDECKKLLAQLEGRAKRTPYIDTIDVRYRRFENKPKPISRAVMLAVMDVSASMGEKEKELAKRFFLLLYVFLNNKYDELKLVFIRHTQDAEEVDEQTFFYDHKTGGTTCSSAIKLSREILKERFPITDYNIYVAHASDGDNTTDDEDAFEEELGLLLPMVQYYAYLETKEPKQNHMSMDYNNRDTSVWRSLQKVSKGSQRVAMRRAFSPNQIFEVFCDLFRKRSESETTNG